MNNRTAYSATTAAIYSFLFYILIKSPDGTGFFNSPIATFDYRAILRLAFLYPFVCYIILIGFVFVGGFAAAILTLFHINTDEITRAAVVHIPIAVLLGILAMAFGIKIIGELVI